MARAVQLVLVSSLCLVLASAGKDGFNLYKDYLRSRKEDAMIRNEVLLPKLYYFYRTSPNLVSTPNFDEFQESLEMSNKRSLQYGKRTMFNQFKNYMLTREPPEMQHELIVDNKFTAEQLAQNLAKLATHPIPARWAKREIRREEDEDDKRAVFSWSKMHQPQLDLSNWFRSNTAHVTSSQQERKNDNKQR